MLTKQSFLERGKGIALYDRWVVMCYLFLLAVGILSIAGSSGSFETTALFEMGSRPMKQLVWIGVTFGILLLLLFADSSLFFPLTPLIYLAVILLLIATLLLAPDIKGSRSWLVLGPLRLQPAELAKLATALMLSNLFANQDFQLQGAKSYLKVFLVILLPASIILLQSEAGSALVFTAFMLVLFREGLPGIYLATAFMLLFLFVLLLYTANTFWGETRLDYFLAASVISVSTLLFLRSKLQKRHQYHTKRLIRSSLIVYLIALIINMVYPFDLSIVALSLLGGILLYLLVVGFYHQARRFFYTILFSLLTIAYSLSVDYAYNNLLRPHQQDRIAIALGIKEDIRGAGYNVNQAKIAIGSGGFTGKGFLKGTQTKLNYVPEQDTDFIFCTIGEEFGFLGSLAVLLVYLLLLFRLLVLAERQPHRSARVYGYSVVSVLFFHLSVNVGMVVGLVPVIGIPLPFVSYGGSSLLFTSLMLFIFLLIDRDNRKLASYRK